MSIHFSDDRTNSIIFLFCLEKNVRKNNINLKKNLTIQDLNIKPV